MVSRAHGLALGLGLTRHAGLGGGGGAPAVISAPVVTGTGYVGYTLTASDGLWSNVPSTIAKQWGYLVPAIKSITCGGASMIREFLADTGFDAGSSYSVTTPIGFAGLTNPAPMAVYQSIHQNPAFTYTITGLTPGASYTVRLHFVELYFSTAASRVFNVTINGNAALSGFDVFTQAGGQYLAIIREFTATATAGGTIVLAFTATVDQAAVSAIEIVPTVAAQTFVPIPSSTASTYAVTVIDEGTPLACKVTATNGNGSLSVITNAVEQWVPGDLGSTLFAWFDAEDAASVTLATGVSRWADKSGNRDHLTQANAGLQPVYSATGWSGTRPGVVYDGTRYVVSSTAMPRLRKVAGGLVAMAAKPDAVTVNVVTNYLQITTPSNLVRFNAPRSTGNPLIFQVRLRALDGDGVTTVSTTSSPGGAAPHVVLAAQDYTVGQFHMRVDGTAGTPVSAGTVTALTSDTNAAGLLLGHETGPSNLFVGQFHEVLCLNSLPAVAVREKIEAYLAWRAQIVGNLPVGHTWKNGAPTP